MATVRILLGLLIGGLAWSQVTPNIGLNIPALDAQNWAPLLNSNFSSLDSYLSGNAGIPGLRLATTGAQGACGSGNRGGLFIVQGNGSTTTDTFEVCGLTISGYAWETSTNAPAGNSPVAAIMALNTYWLNPTLANVIGNTFTGGTTGIPQIGLSTWVRQNSTTGDGVAITPACVAGVNGASCLGMNIVLGDYNGTYTSPTLGGIEVDIEGYSTPTSNSIGYSAVQYNVQNPSPAFIARNGNGAVAAPAWNVAFQSDAGAAAYALYANTLAESGNNTASQPIAFRSVDSGGTGRLNEIYYEADGRLLLQGIGWSSHSPILQQVNINTCTTAASAGATCAQAVTWPTTFADTSYNVECTIAAISGTPLVINEQNSRTAAGTTILIGTWNSTASTGSLSCLATHR